MPSTNEMAAAVGQSGNWIWIASGLAVIVLIIVLWKKCNSNKSKAERKPREGAKISLGDVQETALIPVAIKASESLRKQPRVYDEKAIEMINDLGLDTDKYDQFFSHEGVIARTILFDEKTRELLEKHPDATVVNIGCGFDDRFSRVDNGKANWYHVDFPDLIEVRKRFFGTQERQTCLAGDLSSDNWTEGIPNDRVTIIIAEGLLMYFTEEKVKGLLKQIRDHFKQGYLLAELMPAFVAGKEGLHDTVKNTKAHFTFGAKDGKQLEGYCEGYTLLSQASFFEAMKRYSFLAKIADFFFRRFMNYLSVYEFK